MATVSNKEYPPVVVSSHDASFNFDLHHPKTACVLEIKVKELYRAKDKDKTGYHVYDITYSTGDLAAHPEDPLCNPLLTQEDSSEKYIGEIVHANDLTKSMIEWLLMSYEDMENRGIGLHTPQAYKLTIMKALSLMWD